MGFSLAGFGAGLAESAVERIEEERKFSNLALQGRIERASVLKLQQDKQAKEMEDELRARRDELVQYGVEDPRVQKAYLVSPVAFEALKKAKTSTEPELRAIDPAKLITINQDKLSKMTGTADDFIRNAVRPQQGAVEPAKLLEPQGRSFFAPSAESQRTRFGQLAAARGLTMEEVARAESGVGPKMPEPVGAINFEAYPKKEKRPLTAAEMKDRALVAYQNLAEEKGENDPETIAAKTRVQSIIVREKNLTPEQDKHAANMARAQAIEFDPTGKYSPEEKKWATSYLKNYEEFKKRTEAKGGSDDKVPAPSSLVSIARTAGANAVRSSFGTGAAGKQLSFIENADGSTSVRYTGNDPDMQKQLIRREQEGIVASLRPYMSEGKVTDKKVEVALQAFGISLDNSRRPVLIDAPAPAPAPAKPALPERTPAQRVPGPGRAGQGAVTPAPAAAQDKFVVGKEYVDAQGNRATYRGNGQWEPVKR
jgi:hypothetical protein